MSDDMVPCAPKVARLLKAGGLDLNMEAEPVLAPRWAECTGRVLLAGLWFMDSGDLPVLVRRVQDSPDLQRAVVGALRLRTDVTVDAYFMIHEWKDG